MEFFLIYLFVMIENIAAALSVGWLVFWIGIVIVVFAVAWAGFCADVDCQDRGFEFFWKEHSFTKLCKFVAKFMIPVGFIMGTMGHFTPDQKQLAIIVASGVTYNVVTSEPAQRIGGKALILLEQKINDALEAEDDKEEKDETKETIEHGKQSSGKTPSNVQHSESGKGSI